MEKRVLVSPQGAELLAFKNKIKDEDIKKYKRKEKSMNYMHYTII